jgi:hypothetical protein
VPVHTFEWRDVPPTYADYLRQTMCRYVRESERINGRVFTGRSSWSIGRVDKKSLRGMRREH